MEKRLIIDNEELQFDKKYDWKLIRIPEKPDGSLLHHDYFGILYDIYDRTQSTHQDIYLAEVYIKCTKYY